MFYSGEVVRSELSTILHCYPAFSYWFHKVYTRWCFPGVGVSKACGPDLTDSSIAIEEGSFLHLCMCLCLNCLLSQCQLECCQRIGLLLMPSLCLKRVIHVFLVANYRPITSHPLLSKWWRELIGSALSRNGHLYSTYIWGPEVHLSYLATLHGHCMVLLMKLWCTPDVVTIMIWSY